MKKIYYLFIIVMMASCTKYLDVKPKGVLIPKTVEDYDKLLNNPAISFTAANNLWPMDPDTYLNDKLYAALWQRQWQKQYTWDPIPYDANATDYDWNYRYNTLLVVNEVINNVDAAELGKAIPSKRNMIKGEALAQRAMEMFLLVNEYAPTYSTANLSAPGVPMPLKVELNTQMKKSTVGEIYQQILADLTAADALMVDAPDYMTTANFRPGKAAVKALLANVYLFMGDFAKAVTYSNDALAKYSFMYDYNTIQNKTAGNQWSGYNMYDFDYSTDCKEVLWNRYGRWGFYDPAQMYSDDMISIFDKSNDRRWLLHAIQKTYFGADVSPGYCYARYYAENNAGITIPVLTLINAEAKARTNDDAGAVIALNKIRAKRFLPAAANYTFTNHAALITEIKNERRREVFATGLNVFDLKRYAAYGDAVPTYTRTVAGTTYTLEPGSAKYVVPVSLKVKNLNPNL